MKQQKNEESRFHHPFNPPRRHQKEKQWGPSATKQEFAKDADINTLVGRYGIGPLAQLQGQQFYFDATNVPDYHAGMSRMTKAREEFEALPAKIRARFNHDPGNLVAFLNDASNKDEAIRLGLVNAPPPPPPAPEPPPGGEKKP